MTPGIGVPRTFGAFGYTSCRASERATFQRARTTHDIRDSTSLRSTFASVARMPRDVWSNAVRRSVAALFAFSLAACTSSTNATSFYSSSAVVFGRVTTATGAPALGAWLRSRAYTCDTGEWQGSGSPDIAASDSSSNYRQLIVSKSVGTHCVSVTVSPPAGVSGRDTTVMAGVLRFKRSESPPYDSLRIDVRLP